MNEHTYIHAERDREKREAKGYRANKRDRGRQKWSFVYGHGRS